MKQKINIIDEYCKIKILVCYYQPWKLPDGELFYPIQAGKAVSGFNLKMQGDDTGDNISHKNATFSEFTAWYWAWKNIRNYFPNIEYIGLSHYRRFFCMDKICIDGEIKTLNIPLMPNYEKYFINDLNKNDIILVKPEIFSYNLKTHYSYYHNIDDYLCIKNIVHEIYPEYDESFFHIFEKNNKISLYCLFVAKYNIFNNYFNWLFPLLFELERRIDVTMYPDYQKRAIAFLAERLLNVYVFHNKLKVKYRPIYFICKDKFEIRYRNVKMIYRMILIIINSFVYRLSKKRELK